jgi:hypothetical protein
MHELGNDPVAWRPARAKTFLAEQLAEIRKLVDSGRVKM